MEAEALPPAAGAIAESLAARKTATEIADAACLSPLVTLFMGDTREAREIQATMQAGCAEAARIRAEMTHIQAEAARTGSALMQRDPPAASGRRDRRGAGVPPPKSGDRALAPAPDRTARQKARHPLC